MTLEFITADELAPFRHGFFTRKGGVSSGIFSGLNCGPGSTDQDQAVLTNRRLAAQAMGATEADLSTIHQTHSVDAVEIKGTATKIPRPKCDAMVSRTEGAVLGIQTADCQPVLFADAKAGVIGAEHAGWKGALNGVLQSTIDAMEKIGAIRRDIAAVIGPTISQRAYEVGPEFFDLFLAEDPAFSRFFAAGTGDRLIFDLPSFGLHQLRAAGIGSARWTGHCTFSDPDRFYSYRRTTHAREVDYGRLISIIRL